MLKAVAHGYPITDPRTGLRTHGLGIFTNFSPFDPIKIIESKHSGSGSPASYNVDSKKLTKP